MEEYKKLFGIDFAKSKMSSRDLPLYLSARRSFYKLSYSGIEFILIKLSSDEKFGVVAFKKQANQISAQYGMPVAFAFDNVSRLQRDSLINQNIPFISESGQLYLPFLGIALQNRFYNSTIVLAQKMMPVTQALFLYMLYNNDAKPLIKKVAAEKIGVTQMSITRASEQLSAMGLVTQERKGKETFMLATASGSQWYEMAKSYLISPIQRTITTPREKWYSSCPLSGESALANQTLLNNPKIEVRAVLKSKVDIKKMQSVDTRWESYKDVVLLELWKYDPGLFAKNGIVDPISLAKCYENNVDERIEASIEEYLEGIKW